MKNALSVFILIVALAASTFAVSPGMMRELEVIKRVEPKFPPQLLILGITQGAVRSVLAIDEAGQVVDMLITAHTHELVAAAVLEVLPQWRFQTAMLGGRPVPSQTTLTVTLNAVGVVVSMDPTTYAVRRLDDRTAPNFTFAACRLQDLDALPIPRRTVAPRYPAELARDNIRGIVRVDFYIDQDGRVRMPLAQQADHVELAAYAIEAVKQWQFSPPLRRGRPVLVHASQDFHFGR